MAYRGWRVVSDDYCGCGCGDWGRSTLWIIQPGTSWENRFTVSWVQLDHVRDASWR
jgi:hypothetical protein